MATTHPLSHSVDLGASALREPSPALCFAFPFIVQFFLLMAVSNGPRFIAASIVVGLAWIAAFHRVVLPNLARNAILFTYAAFSLLSAFWSIYPVKSLYSASQLTVTLMIGIAAGTMPHRRSGYAGLALAFILYTLVAFAFGHSVGWEKGTAFTGLNNGKNAFGHVSAQTGLASLGLLTWARGRRAILVVIAIASAMVLAVAGLILSHATGSTIGFAIGLAGFVAFSVVGRGPPMVKFVVLLVFATLTVTYLTFGAQLEQAFWNWVLVTFNKDPGLTGRDYLWYFADQLRGERPILGLGYNAFWTEGNVDAEGLWALMGIASKSGFNFHSTYRDLLVEGGWVGMILYVLSLGIPSVRLGLRVFARGDLLDAAALTVLLYFICRLPFESWFIGPWSPDSILLLFCLAAPAQGWSTSKTVVETRRLLRDEALERRADTGDPELDMPIGRIAG